MKPKYPYKRPVWLHWKEATMEQVYLSSCLYNGYYYRICPECECECEATNETLNNKSFQLRTYICRNCRLVFRLVHDFEEAEVEEEARKEKPTPFTTPEVSPSKPAVLSRMPEREQKESYHEEGQKKEITIPRNLRYLLG